MNLEDAENFALTLMEDNGIGNTWSFAFDNAKIRCGRTNHTKRLITLSRYYVESNGIGEVRDTIMHEIAHVKAGHAAGHGPAWQTWAIRLGARPERCAVDVVMPEGAIKGKCSPTCKANGQYSRHRMPPKHLLDAYQCSRCLSKVTWIVLK